MSDYLYSLKTFPKETSKEKKLAHILDAHKTAQPLHQKDEGWQRDLLRECVEPNPGPISNLVGTVSQLGFQPSRPHIGAWASSSNIQNREKALRQILIEFISNIHLSNNRGDMNTVGFGTIFFTQAMGSGKTSFISQMMALFKEKRKEITDDVLARIRDNDKVFKYLEICSEYRLVYIDLKKQTDVRASLGDDVTWVKLMILQSALFAEEATPETWKIYQQLSFGYSDYNDVVCCRLNFLFSILKLKQKFVVVIDELDELQKLPNGEYLAEAQFVAVLYNLWEQIRWIFLQGHQLVFLGKSPTLTTFPNSRDDRGFRKVWIHLDILEKHHIRARLRDVLPPGTLLSDHLVNEVALASGGIPCYVDYLAKFIQTSKFLQIESLRKDFVEYMMEDSDRRKYIELWKQVDSPIFERLYIRLLEFSLLRVPLIYDTFDSIDCSVLFVNYDDATQAKALIPGQPEKIFLPNVLHYFGLHTQEIVSKVSPEWMKYIVVVYPHLVVHALTLDDEIKTRYPNIEYLRDIHAQEIYCTLQELSDNCVEARSFVHYLLLNGKLANPSWNLMRLFVFLEEFEVGKLSLSECCRISSGAKMLPAFGQVNSRSIAVLEKSKDEADQILGEEHRKLLSDIFDGDQSVQVDNYQLHTNDLLLLRQIIQKKKFIGRLQPLQPSSSFDWNLILSHSPKTFELSFRAQKEEITIHLIRKEILKFCLQFPEDWSLTAVFYNVKGEINIDTFCRPKRDCVPPPKDICFCNVILGYRIAPGSLLSPANHRETEELKRSLTIPYNVEILVLTEAGMNMWIYPALRAHLGELYYGHT